MFMSFRSTRTSRRFLVPALGMAAIVGLAWAGQPATGDGPTAAPSTKDAEKAKAKSEHPRITALRDRVLASFHGQTADLFTSIPGFGMERMPSVYKYVPFEIPDLSTNEVEVEKEPAVPEALKDLFARSREAFHEPAKPLPKTKSDRIMPTFMAGGGVGANVVVRGLQLRLLDLVGLTNSDGPKVYSGGKAFEAQRMSIEELKAARAKDAKFGLGIVPPPRRPEKDDGTKVEIRPLDVFETAGVAELSQGKNLFIRNRGNVIRMLGALRAADQCVKCHTDSKKGDLLGALSYTFVDTDKTLEKATKGTSAK
jgi:hypothetical protein